MANSNSFVQTTTVEIAKLFAPLARVNTPGRAAAFIRDMGWDFAGHEVPLDLRQLIDRIDSLLDAAGRLAAATTDEARMTVLEDLTKEIPAVVLQLRADVPLIRAAVQNLPDLSGDATDL